MKKAGMIGCVLIIGVLLLAGCDYARTYAEKSSDESDFMVKYLADRDLSVVSTEGIVDEYLLNREVLLTPPYQHLWALQDAGPEDYIGERIEVHQFIVENHPLDQLAGNTNEQTIVWLMVVKDKVIGGYSFPDFEDPHYGGVYSLEGKTLEEVTGLSFQEWRIAWEKKYQ